LLRVYTVEALAMAGAGLLAFVLRLDGLPPYYVRPLLTALAVWIPIKLVSFRLFGLDRRWARYVSMADLVTLVWSNLCASLVSFAILYTAHSGVPRYVYANDFVLALSLTAGIRVCVRLAVDSARRRAPSEQRIRTLIYGAGDAGMGLAREVRQNSSLNYDICGFIDDDPNKRGAVLHGIKVLGVGQDLTALARSSGAELALIAIPSASGPQMSKILTRCTAAGIRSKTIPGLAELIDESGLARQIRDVAVEDLLGRVPVHLDQDRISGQLRDRVVLVTGAAGSIGSEICRQVARFRPKAIVGFEIAESPLFTLHLEMTRHFPNVPFHAEIGSIQSAVRLREVFEKHRPSVVFHAAAYKHVPLMESHIFEAVENNVFGTLNVVEQARAHGVTEFVMISSDKAVRPVNVMGATKRVAEIMVRALRPAEGRYVSVRFGNVLGSSGSVVPIFKEQIARGGPVTVTHPDMRRYFMTIPEACQLVLQASAMGRGSEIFVLDMGEPVRIIDLARNLISLSGLQPDRDIEIVVTGTRPGEKLFEELNEETEGLLPTHHEKIRTFEGQTVPRVELDRLLGQARLACRERDCGEAMALLREIVPEFTPGESLVAERANAGAVDA
jgi:FlaA1/EpsC-like NDP-sugar epimerase